MKILSYELQCISPGRTCVLLWVVKNAPEHRAATVELVTSRVVVADRVTAYNNVTSVSEAVPILFYYFRKRIIIISFCRCSVKSVRFMSNNSIIIYC